MTIIDAHHHLWAYNPRDYAWMTDELAGLRRDFLVPELETATKDLEVVGTVVVQASQTVDESQWLLDIAARTPSILGVVGWAPLNDSSVESILEQLTQHPRLRAVRHILQDEPDDRFMLREDFNRGVRLLSGFGVAYDILIYERHLPQAIEFVDRHPQQVFILDHLAKPRIREGFISPWRENIGELARRENVFCKLSGMVTEADWKTWTVETLRPYFDVVLSAFGADRLMFGSDWPVLTLAVGYSAWVNAVRVLVADLSADEQESIFRASARRAYRLGVPGPGQTSGA